MHHPKLRISEPGELVAAVPAMLGFYPTDSLVLALLVRESPGKDRSFGAIARHDLGAGDAQLTNVAEQLAAVAADCDAESAMILLVDSTARPGPVRFSHRQILNILNTALADRRVDIEAAFATPKIAPGSSWWNLIEPHESGTMPDPDASPIAVARVLEGRPIRRSRDNISESIEVDRPLAARVRDLLSDAADTHPRQSPDVDDTAHHRAAVTSTLARIDQLTAGTVLTTADFAELAVALRIHTVRDCLFGLVDTERVHEAQHLWALLTRSLPDPERAEAATLLSFSAYHNGDGPLAVVAATAARDSAPNHRCAHLILQALVSGLPPHQLQPIVDGAHRIAATLDIDLRR